MGGGIIRGRDAIPATSNDLLILHNDRPKWTAVVQFNILNGEANRFAEKVRIHFATEKTKGLRHRNDTCCLASHSLQGSCRHVGRFGRLLQQLRLPATLRLQANPKSPNDESESTINSLSLLAVDLQTIASPPDVSLDDCSMSTVAAPGQYNQRTYRYGIQVLANKRDDHGTSRGYGVSLALTKPPRAPLLPRPKAPRLRVLGVRVTLPEGMTDMANRVPSEPRPPRQAAT